MAYSREQLKSVFNRAVEVPVADRPALLDRLGLDPDLRRQVEGLLAAHVDAASFLEAPAVGHLDMSSEHGSSLSPGSRLGPYEVVDFLGAGGMGQVYRARDTRLRREVALKVLQSEIAGHTDHVARFRREATAAAALSHPNICTIYEIGDAQGQTFIAMEYVAGQTLQARLAGPPLTMTEVLDIAIQLADGLNEARQRHVVHRDLKSANVVLTARGQVKILDFGLAKQLHADGAGALTTAELTRAGMLMGTLAYMSPEQARGAEVDHRSDLFSFGVVLYELLTGRRPFDGASTADVLHAVISAPPAPIPRYNNDVPDTLVRLVSKLLEKDPERRYQSAHDVWIDLRRIREEHDGTATAQPVSRKALPRTLPVRAAVLAVVILLGAVTAWGVKTFRENTSGRSAMAERDRVLADRIDVDANPPMPPAAALIGGDGRQARR